VRDYSIVTDMAGWIASIAVGRRFPRGRVMNLGSGRGVVLKDFVLAIAGALGGRHLMKFGGLEYRGTEMRRVVADIRAQRRWLGRTGRTPLLEALRAMLASRDGPRGS
jgi:nucleoside-diphosphate-sugar epimerase